MKYKDIQTWNNNGLVTEKEYKFLSRVYSKPRGQLTDKQSKWLDAIEARAMKGTVVSDVFEKARQQSVSVF